MIIPGMRVGICLGDWGGYIISIILLYGRVVISLIYSDRVQAVSLWWEWGYIGQCLEFHRSWVICGMSKSEICRGELASTGIGGLGAIVGSGYWFSRGSVLVVRGRSFLFGSYNWLRNWCWIGYLSLWVSMNSAGYILCSYICPKLCLITFSLDIKYIFGCWYLLWLIGGRNYVWTPSHEWGISWGPVFIQCWTVYGIFR